ncbi:MAG TPA: alpha-2-macroglobulin family protein, partial [Alphaproteobacteria bacterium]|nr:alpha-2-macroglobulin family protein [Alphaproteobacteria bacterium]
MRSMPFKSLWPVFSIALLLGTAADRNAFSAEESGQSQIVKQPAGAQIVPDKFLRRWDPVTIFFDRNVGPADGGAEHAPEKYVTVTPAHPGAFTWLNGRTLQFRPAEAWPALGRYEWKVGDKGTVLASLMDAPTASIPSNGAANLDPVDSVTLTFAQPVDPKVLAKMLDIEIAPLPGLDRSKAKRIDDNDFTVKTVERGNRADAATYVIAFRQPIPAGMRATVTLGLSAEPGLDATVQRISFTTSEIFQPIFLGCAEKRVPVSADGNSYDKNAALSCKTESEQIAGTGAPRRHNPDQDAEPSSGDQGQEGNAEGEGEGGDQDGTPQDSESADSGDDQADTGTTDANGKQEPVVDSHPLMEPLPTTTAATPAVGPALHKAADSEPRLSSKREIVVQFSAMPAGIDPIAARNLVRITPAVEGVKSTVVGDQLHVVAKFQTDTLYEIALEPTTLKDTRGRALVMNGRSAAYLFWPAEKPFLNLAYGTGMVERFGPQMVPMHGRGYAEADVRIHAVDPLDRSFWPFPLQPVVVNEDDRPPSPGEEVQHHTEDRPIDTDELMKQLQRLGSPSVSELEKLPLTPLGTSARFGLNLAPAFARISGKDHPGTYLVGIRRLDKENTREWMRVQVTDLSVSMVEEEKSVRFFVTSLSDGHPVEKAEVRIEGGDHDKWTKIASGQTGSDGHFTWERSNLGPARAQLRRIVVVKGDDVLTVDPGAPLDRYSANGWFPTSGNTLDWMQGNLANRHPAPRTLCHVFTERPIYRPDDPVHIKAYVRELANGALTPGGQGMKTEIVVNGPDDAEWRYPLPVDEAGNIHYLFAEKTTATGTYEARIAVNGVNCSTALFKKDAYRLPKFQVRLDAPKTIPLDKPVNVGMTATYYAGGAASDRPVRWRVTQFPYAFTPKAREGFAYATDSRYQAGTPFEGSATQESSSKTDGEGRDHLTLDPTREKTNQPRRYVVEATVIGDDDKTVTNTEEVLALPAFVLGMKVPRYIEKADRIPIEVLMVDGNGNPLAGKPVTVRLLERQWSSILQASDFTEGKPKYRTEVVDEKRMEKTVNSGSDTVKLDLPVSESGVYIVQIESSDDLGRRQMVQQDLFVGGNQPVTWSRPPAQVFKVTTDKAAYIPGETANLVLESPFQTGRALAIVEMPNGVNRYEWLDVKNGYGKFGLAVDKTFMPRIPVHFALMRGRLKGEGPDAGGIDLRRPETLAATAWVGVKPVKNIVTVKVENQDMAQPGDTVELTVRLSDDTGKPLAGEVTLWMIDQAVLALAKEAPLDPLPAFIRDRGSKVAFSDTRNSVFGSLPLDEDPGGDVGAGDQALLNKVTIRKNFQPVPYYNPSLMVNASGVAKVQVKLPDNLTNFKIRAKAVSGPDRFGFATGNISVRLPVIVEPNLPRFVRPGDQFTLSAIGRVVEGAGGPGQAQAKADGLDVTGPLTRTFDWTPGQPQHLDFAATVPTPA